MDVHNSELRFKVNPRQRILTILNGGRPDRVPWFGDLDYWATALIGQGIKPADFKQSRAYIDWHRDLGVGFYLQGYFPFKTIIENCNVKEWKEDNRRFRQVDTPKGTLRECWTWMPASYTEGPTEHLVKSADDLPAYQYLHENTRYEPDYEFAYQRIQQIGDMGIFLAYLPKSPLMQLVALDAGIMTMMDIIMQDQAAFTEAIHTIKQSHDRAAEISLASPAEVLMIPENLSSEMIGPSLFKDYMLPYQREWAGRIKKAGKFSTIHMDGTLKGLLREETAVGFTFIEAMTPAPAGDLPVAEWAGFTEDKKTIFWGGIPGGFFTPMISDREFDEFVIEVLSVMTQQPRYVLGVADQVPPDGLESRVRRVAELVEQYGRYR
jgi:uroporphyrinogen-III decarboxylase